jgi:hypothetical protein
MYFGYARGKLQKIISTVYKLKKKLPSNTRCVLLYMRLCAEYFSSIVRVCDVWPTIRDGREGCKYSHMGTYIIIIIVICDCVVKNRLLCFSNCRAFDPVQRTACGRERDLCEK